MQDEIAKQATALQARWHRVLEISSIKSEYSDAANGMLAFIQNTVENGQCRQSAIDGNYDGARFSGFDRPSDKKIAYRLRYNNIKNWVT